MDSVRGHAGVSSELLAVGFLRARGCSLELGSEYWGQVWEAPARCPQEKSLGLVFLLYAMETVIVSAP